jgi:uncharacterized membrane protein
MKSKELLLVITLTIIMSFVSVLIFTRPAIFNIFDLSNSGNIGDAIGGITAPVLGLISIILLYITLNRQIESIKDQKIKNESDMIFLLINQFDAEYNSFFLYVTSNKIREKIVGFEALTYLCNCIDSMAQKTDNKTIGKYYFTNQIICIIRSYKLIEQRIELSTLSADIKQVFSKKLQIIYESKLKDQMKNFVSVVNSVDFLKDEVSMEIEDFFIKHQ